jgi:hypothetical protein
MYRFLDKRFHHKPDWTFDLKELAHEHIGLGRNYEGPAHLKRNLQPAIEELVSIGFLAPLPDTERFPKDGKNWKIRLLQSMPPALPTTEAPKASNSVSPPGLAEELTNRGVSRVTAVELLQQHPAEAIQAKIDVFDWLVDKQDKRVAKSPAGYLVKSITDDYATPKGFVTKAERQAREQAHQAREAAATAERRRQQEEEARERAEKKAVTAYWESLTPQQQAELDAAVNAQADPQTLASETGVLKKFGQQLRRDEHIRQLLCDRQKQAAEA